MALRRRGPAARGAGLKPALPAVLAVKERGVSGFAALRGPLCRSEDRRSRARSVRGGNRGGKCERGGWPPLSQERQRESGLAAIPGRRLWFSRVQEDAASPDSRHEVPFGLGVGPSLTETRVPSLKRSDGPHPQLAQREDRRSLPRSVRGGNRGGKCERGGWPPLSQERQRESGLAAIPGRRLWFSRVQEDAASPDSRHEVPFGLGVGPSLTETRVPSLKRSDGPHPQLAQREDRRSLPRSVRGGNRGGKCERGGWPPLSQERQRESGLAAIPGRRLWFSRVQEDAASPDSRHEVPFGLGVGPSLTETRVPSLKRSDGPHPQPDQRAVPKQGFEP